MAKVRTRTRSVDHGFKGIIKELKKLENKPFVKIGYPAEVSKKDAKKKDGSGATSEFVTVLDVAVFHEFGTVNLPERSFIRASFDDNVKKYEKMNKKLLIKIYSNKMTVERALDILGEMILNDIKKFMINNEVKPVSIRASNDSGSTLVDTAQLMNSLTFKRIMK
jgi:hypothetical protein